MKKTRKKLTSDVIHPKKNYHQINDIEFLVYSPPGMQKTKQYPTVFVCISNDENIDKFPKKSGWLHIPDSVIVAFIPISNLNNQAIDGIINELKNNYPMDSSKLYASGFSKGFEFILTSLIPNKTSPFSAFAGIGFLPTAPIYSKNKHNLSVHISVAHEEITEKMFLEKDVYTNPISIITNLLQLKNEYKIIYPKQTIRFVYANSHINNSFLIIELFKLKSNTNFPNNMARKQWYFFKYHKEFKDRI